MARSQNGYSANDRSKILSIRVPGGKLAVRKGDVAIIMQYIAEQFHATVEPLKWPGNWGYAERPIRGGSALSNHASGTAIDLNAPRHPLGKRGTFTKKQVAAIRRILSACGGTIRWGGDYRSRADEMHFEINAGAAAVKDVAKRLRPKLQGPSVPGASSNGSSSGGSGSYRTVKYGEMLRRGVKGDPVKEWQRKALGYTGKKADGFFGPDTERDTKAFQARHGVAADGIVGPDTWPLRNKGTKKPAPKPAAPAFPLPTGHWFGPESRDRRNHSGYWVPDRTHIKRIQKALGIKADGIYGPRTKDAVERFQRAQKIRVDGGVGAQTWKRLFK